MSTRMNDTDKPESRFESRGLVSQSRMVFALLLLTLVIAMTAATASAQVRSAVVPGRLSTDAPSHTPNSYEMGEHGVSLKTGDASYHFPIVVPPGRKGMEPRIALHYSSYAPLRGGIAAGWTMPIASIKLDASGSVAHGLSYRVSMDGIQGRLVKITDTSDCDECGEYRLHNDDSFVRFHLHGMFGAPFFWTAKTPDGTTYTFGIIDQAVPWDSLADWPLSRVEDAYGNHIEYIWEIVEVDDMVKWLPFPSDFPRGHEVKLRSIIYGGNRANQHLSHARVEFNYDGLSVCTGHVRARPNGALLFEGASILKSIITHVRDDASSSASDRQVRKVELKYSGHQRAKCRTDVIARDGHSPVRYLTELRVSGRDLSGEWQTLPATTFEYGPLGRSLSKSTQFPGLDALPYYDHRTKSNVFGLSGVSSVPREADVRLMDIDGDGLLDRFSIDISDGTCRLRLETGRFGGGFNPALLIGLPTFVPENENLFVPDFDCRLSGQIIRRTNVNSSQHCSAQIASKNAFHFVDVTGDGRLELVTQLQHAPNWDPGLDNEVTKQLDYGNILESVLATAAPSSPLPQTDPALCDTDLSCNDLESCISEHLGNLDACLCNNASVREKACELNPDLAACDPTRCEFGLGQAPWSEESWNISNVPLGVPDPEAANWTTCSLRPHKHQDDSTPEDQYIMRIYRLPIGTTGLLHSASNFVPLYSDNFPSLAPAPIVPMPGTDMFGSPALLDLDGDRRADLIVPPTGTQCDGWLVFGGRGDGTFSPQPHCWAITDPKRDHPAGRTSGSAVPPDVNPVRFVHYGGLVDINGDGLPDLISNPGPDQPIRVYLNTGRGFSLVRPFGWGLGLLGLIGSSHYEIEETRVEAWEWESQGENWLRKEPIESQRKKTKALLDVDGDGLSDIAHLIENEVWVQFGNGVTFGPPQQLDALWSAALRQVAVFRRGTRTDPETGDQSQFESREGWWVESDFIDLLGTGMPQIVRMLPCSPLSYPCGVEAIHDDLAAGPPRLLRKVDNGRGGTITFHYTHSKDPHAKVVANAETSPLKTWVVSRIDFASTSAASPTATTVQYRYSTPVFGSPYAGMSHRFLGFRQMGQFLPTGSSILSTFDYSPLVDDRRGRLIEELTFPSYDQTAQVHTRREIEWAARPLYHDPSQLIARDRPIGQHQRIKISELHTTYDNSGSPHVNRQEFEWQPVAFDNDNRIMLYYQHRTLIGSGRNSSVGADRARVVRTPTAQSKSDSPYFVLTGEVETYDATTKTLVGRTATTFDDLGCPIATISQIDSAGTHAVTTRTCDEFGNVSSVMQPNQQGIGLQTKFEYDSLRLFIQRATNELGHRVLTFHDTGTGALTRRLGPNHKPVWFGGLPRFPWIPWSGGLWLPKWQEERFELDAIGRVIRHWVSQDSPQSGYELTLVAKTQYHDDTAVAPAGECPSGTSSCVVRENRLDFIDNLGWTRDAVGYDGLGRTLVEVQHTDEAATSVATSHYAYHPATGLLESMLVPDPTIDDGSHVQYDYLHDSLGRLVRTNAPLGLYVRLHYNGLRRSIIQPANPGSSEISTTYERDVFGLLRSVRDAEDGVTTYDYDAAGNLISVEDADETLTTFAHDFHGRRTEITRGSRTWRYVYDLNGNLQSREEPPGGVDHGTRWQYDALDRVVAEFAATRGMTPAEMSRLGIGTVVYEYDTGGNGIGRLARVRLHDKLDEDDPLLQTDAPFAQFSFDYTPQGAVEEARAHVSVTNPVLPGSDVETTQIVQRKFNPLGQVVGVEHLKSDGEGTIKPAERYCIIYDRRALTKKVLLFDPTVDQCSTDLVIADFAVSQAGQLRSSTNSFGSLSSYVYDELGRIITHEVLGLDQSYTRTIDYWPNGEVRQLKDDLAGLNTAKFATEFFYDNLGRITQALDNGVAGGYQGQFSYTPAGNVLSADVNWPDSDLSRQVNYIYGDGSTQDPEAVVSLSGDLSASFSYDLAGNMTRRDIGGNVTDLVWDGAGRLREAIQDSTPEVYYYDQAAQRFAMFNDDGTRLWLGATELHFDTAGNEVKRYVRVSAGGPTLARIEDEGAVELQFADGRQNLMAAFDDQSRLTASFVYGAFGEGVEQFGPKAGEHRQRYNEKEHDQHTSLRYYGARYYDPISLRWISADPLYRFSPEVGITEPQRLNLYAFSLNNPIRYWDSDGLHPLGVAYGLYRAGKLAHKGYKGYRTWRSVRNARNAAKAARMMGATEMGAALAARNAETGALLAARVLSLEARAGMAVASVATVKETAFVGTFVAGVAIGLITPNTFTSTDPTGMLPGLDIGVLLGDLVSQVASARLSSATPSVDPPRRRAHELQRALQHDGGPGDAGDLGIGGDGVDHEVGVCYGFCPATEAVLENEVIEREDDSGMCGVDMSCPGWDNEGTGIIDW